MASTASASIPPSRAHIVGVLTRKLPLYRERGVTRATIFVNGYTIHLRGHDAAATQSLAIGSRVEIVGIVRRSGRRNLVNEIDGELVT
jgi:primosomal replication protein N